MELTSIVELLALLLGGGGLVGFIAGFATFKYMRRQEAAKTKHEEADAVTAEVTAMKEMQDVYQQMTIDLKTAWKEQKEYISELHEDRRALRDERNELKDRIEKNEEKIREQADEIAELRRKVDLMTLLICTKADCPMREKNKMTLIDDKSFATEVKSGEKKEKK